VLLKSPLMGCGEVEWLLMWMIDEMTT